MAHFYVEMRGSGQAVSRCGNKNSDITAHLRGWDVGVRVLIEFNKELQRDEVSIHLTSGSNHPLERRFLGTYTKEDINGDPDSR
jgi:hypothetical protein